MSDAELANVKRVHWVGQSIVIEYNDGRSIVFRQKAAHAYRFLDLWTFNDKGTPRYYYRLRSTESTRQKDGIATLSKSFKVEGQSNFVM